MNKKTFVMAVGISLATMSLMADFTPSLIQPVDPHMMEVLKRLNRPMTTKEQMEMVELRHKIQTAGMKPSVAKAGKNGPSVPGNTGRSAVGNKKVEKWCKYATSAFNQITKIFALTNTLPDSPTKDKMIEKIGNELGTISELHQSVCGLDDY